MNAKVLAALLLLAACSAPPQVVIREHYVQPNIKPELLQKEPLPKPRPGDQQDVAADLLEDAKAALQRANAKIEAIADSLRVP